MVAVPRDTSRLLLVFVVPRGTLRQWPLAAESSGTQRGRVQFHKESVLVGVKQMSHLLVPLARPNLVWQCFPIAFLPGVM